MKYVMTEEKKEHDGRILTRIKNAVTGCLGGWIESEMNLDQEGDAMVYGNARVSDDAEVCDNAKVYGNVEVCGKAVISANTRVFDNDSLTLCGM